VVRLGGGVREWVWKGAKNQAASVELVISNPKGRPPGAVERRLKLAPPLRHLFAFRSDEQGFRVHDEQVENDKPYGGESEAYFYFRFREGTPILTALGGEERASDRAFFYFDRSILAQRRDPELYPALTYLAETYEKWRIYREWAFGRNTIFREPQRADMRNDRLEEDFANLGLFLSRGTSHKARAMIRSCS
jgi:predicted ATPase